MSRCVLPIVLIALLAVAACQSGDSLAGPTWQWTGVQGSSSGDNTVAPDHENYTIEFLMDGTVNVQTDCVTVDGTYAVGIPLDVTIDLPTTPSCGDALTSSFLEDLDRVDTYSTGGGELKLYFPDETGAMQFRASGS
jgi:hypothetical protein